MRIEKLTLFVLLPAALLAADRPVAQTRQTQAAIMPAAALELLKQGNDRFVKGKPLHRNLLKQVSQTASGQYPFATVLSCIDSRTSSELVFDQGIGDIFSARIAGNIATDEILGSLEFASKVAGSKLIVALGHTSCGAVKGAVDDVKLGYVESLVRHIKPAVETARAAHSNGPIDQVTVDRVAEENVKHVLEVIRNRSSILREMLDKGEIAVVGGMHDLKTGKVTFYEQGHR